VVVGGAVVVGDGLRIEAELVEAVAGVVRGWRWWCTWWRSRRLGEGDFTAESRAEGRWCQFEAREVAVDQCTTFGGGD
jgi:hypothetical protein